MTKVFRFLAMFVIALAFAAISSAQSYTSVDFPGAIATTLTAVPIRQAPTSVVTPTNLVSLMVSFCRRAYSPRLILPDQFRQLPTGSVRRESSWAATSTRVMSATVSS